MSVRLLALVEGQTEEQFCKKLVAPFLIKRGIYLSATTMGRPRAAAGVSSWKNVEKELRQLLLGDREGHVTTMFDYYGMPRDWPGRADADDKPHHEKARTVENQMRARMREAVGRRWRTERFIPYVQMHEFEAVLFTKPEVLATVSSPSKDGDAARRLRQVGEHFGTPEEIDDGESTAPSKRILRIVAGYEKVAHGVIAASKIGIPAIREACPHFDGWMRTLEALAGPRSPPPTPA